MLQQASLLCPDEISVRLLGDANTSQADFNIAVAAVDELAARNLGAICSEIVKQHLILTPYFVILVVASKSPVGKVIALHRVLSREIRQQLRSQRSDYIATLELLSERLLWVFLRTVNYNQTCLDTCMTVGPFLEHAETMLELLGNEKGNNNSNPKHSKPNKSKSTNDNEEDSFVDIRSRLIYLKAMICRIKLEGLKALEMLQSVLEYYRAKKDTKFFVIVVSCMRELVSDPKQATTIFSS